MISRNDLARSQEIRSTAKSEHRSDVHDGRGDHDRHEADDMPVGHRERLYFQSDGLLERRT